MLKILIVEDDINLNQLCAKNLTNNGYSVVCAHNGIQALEILNNDNINLMLTDLMMPQMSGQELIREARKEYKQLPIIVITALSEFNNKLDCYKSGIDDYIVKPIDFSELLLRIEALLRRSNLVHQQYIDFNNIHLDFVTKTVLVNKHAVDLTKKEFLILYMLLSHPNRIYSRSEIINEIWDYNTMSLDRTIDVHITNLREKLSDAEIKIINIRGLGYKVEKCEKTNS